MSDRPGESSRVSRWNGDEIMTDYSDKASDAGVSDSGASSLPSPDFTPLDGEFGDRVDQRISRIQAIVDEENSDSSTSSGWESDIPLRLANDRPGRRGNNPPAGPSNEPPARPVTEPPARPARTPQLALPSIVIGSSLGTGLSAIETADAEVERWELIYREILQAQGPEAVVSIAEQLGRAWEARQRLELIDDREAVTSTFLETDCFKRQAVEERVELLRSMLQDAEEPDTITNMQGAIRAYEDGTVGASDLYAIFWAGHFMELASSYEEFTRDRYERTEVYASIHGAGSLWFEPPLLPGPPVVHAGRGSHYRQFYQPMAMRGTATGLGTDNHHFVTMSFQAVKYHREPGYQNRQPGPEGAAAYQKSLEKARRFKGKGTTVKDWHPKPRSKADAGILVANPKKPRLCFSMMLDTGATNPCLYGPDLDALGVKFGEHPAASVLNAQTANGLMKCYVYELHVAVCDTRTGQTLVDPADPVWPSRPHILGGISRVLAMPAPGNQNVRPGHVAELDENGNVHKFLYGAWKDSLTSNAGRLSGLFPTQCCYVQATPGLRTFWFGEDRRDVLGTQRMPGQRRFEPGNNICPPEPDGPEVATLMERHGIHADPARLQMEHIVKDNMGIRLFRIRDIETKKRGRSELIIDDFETKEQSQMVEPRKKRRASMITGESDEDYDDDTGALKRRREARRILAKLRDEALFFPIPEPDAVEADA